ncbi:unnamed protein product [Effrenium voratum]|nr:unnamed protein product [Effrenium voratum]
MLPELIYFLTELALASEDVLAGGSVYEGSGGTRKSNLFLAKITRPIYNVVFEEWYVKVDVDQKTNKDKKVLKDNFHRYLPALASSSKGLVGLVPLLLQKGANVNCTRADGWTPLMSACSSGHLLVSQLLLDAGASVDAAAADGFTALMEACTGGHRELVSLLLQHGASISHATPSGRTALILASLYGHAEVVELLLAHGADTRPNKFTALHAASGNGQGQVVKLLIAAAHWSDSDAAEAFFSACANGHLEVTQQLLQLGVPASSAASDGTTALIQACMGSHREVAAELILHGASLEDAFNTARRRKMPGVTRVLQRAVEEVTSRTGTEGRNLDHLVRNIEGKKKSRRPRHLSTGTGSTSTFLAETSEAAAATESSPKRQQADEEVEAEEDDAAYFASSGCPLTGASWFKVDGLETLEKSSPEPKEPKKQEELERAEPVERVEQVEREPERVDRVRELVPWTRVLEETASRFPESISSRLATNGPWSVRPMPFCREAFYTIEVLGEVEPASPLSSEGSR